MRELNFDVQVEVVCGSLDHVPTILSFSVVSRCFRSMAVKRLLIMKPILLLDARSVCAFHKFVFADPESRLPFLRALELEIPEMDEDVRNEVVQCILDILGRATSLESLNLPDAKYTLQHLADPRIPQAIAQLSTLRELVLLGSCRDEDIIVKATHSLPTLTTLRLSLCSLGTPGGDTSAAAVDQYLAPFAPTLEALTITDARLPLNDRGMQFPALRSLSALFDPEVLRTDILMQKFPALKDLDVSISSPPTGGYCRHEASRSANQQWQERERSWDRLERLIGQPSAIFVLGLTCPVRHLMVEAHIPGEDSREEMAEILLTTPPSHLKLSIWLGRYEYTLQGFFPTEQVQRLTHLALVIIYDNFKTNDPYSPHHAVRTIRWEHLSAQIKNSLQGVQLTHLRLIIKYSVCPTDIMDRDSYYVPFSKGFVEDLLHLDHEETVVGMAAAMPSLQYIQLMTCGEHRVCLLPPQVWQNRVSRGCWRSTSAWLVAASPRGGLEPLEEEASERIIEEEDLFLSDNDRWHLGLHRDWEWTAEETAPWPIPGDTSEPAVAAEDVL